MMSRMKLAAVLAAMAALLALASTAAAKGGGAPCATITSFSVTTGTDADSATIPTDYGVSNGCLEDGSVSVALTYTNQLTGQWYRSVDMQPLGSKAYSFVFNADYATPWTVTVEVYKPNGGKLLDSRTATVTTPAAPVLAAAAA